MIANKRWARTMLGYHPTSTPIIWFNQSTGATTWVTSTNSTSAMGLAQTQALLQAQTQTQTYNSVNQTYYEPPPVVTDLTIHPGLSRKIKLPDGTVVHVAENGSYRIDDSNAKIVYKANRVREFNPFLNASDKLEEFIKFCGNAGVRQGEMMGIPIQHFIAWLIIEAAKADGETAVEQPFPALPDLSTPRCRVCKRFMSRRLKADRIEFCRPKCLEVRLRT